MARFISQTLFRTKSSSSTCLQTLKLGISQPNRFSSQSGKAQLIEIDLESEGEVEVLGLRKLVDVIHNIIVRESAPDWLPFIPGSSYWVPPRQRPESNDIFEALKRFGKPLTEDESMSLTSSRGWPSTTYFIEDPQSSHMRLEPGSLRFTFHGVGSYGTTPMHPVDAKVEVKLFHSHQENSSDEEG